jgi:hypothetical protein
MSGAAPAPPAGAVCARVGLKRRAVVLGGAPAVVASLQLAAGCGSGVGPGGPDAAFELMRYFSDAAFQRIQMVAPRMPTLKALMGDPY